MHFLPFHLKPLKLRMDSAKLLDVLTLLPVSHAILPRAVCFATSRPANHAICSFIDSSGVCFLANQKMFIYRLYNNVPYLLFLKKQHNLKLSSAANYRWRFMG